MKNVDPKILSEMLKLALTYSKAWKPVKITAKTIVRTKPKMASILLLAVIA
jgi:hypothetical protein